MNKWIKVLIATDVSARGIDIPNIEFVVNYDLPDKAENYVHRVGRTGRGNQKGKAIAFCSKEEREMLKEIEEYITVPITVSEIDRTDYTDTLLSSDDGTDNWKGLIEKDFEMKKNRRKKKKKK